MRAAWYDRTGPAREVLVVGERPKPSPGPREVLIRVRASGVNPSDAGMRRGAAGPMAYPRITPNSDGAGVVEAVGHLVSPSMIGKRVWFYNGQRNGRAFGSAAEYIELDAELVRELPDAVGLRRGGDAGHSGHDRPRLPVHGRTGAGKDRAGHRRGGRGRPLCGPAGQVGRRHGDRHRLLAAEGRAGAGRRRGPGDRLPARGPDRPPRRAGRAGGRRPRRRGRFRRQPGPGAAGV